VQEKHLATIPFNIYIIPCNLSSFYVKQFKQDIKSRCNPHFFQNAWKSMCSRVTNAIHRFVHSNWQLW